MERRPMEIPLVLVFFLLTALSCCCLCHAPSPTPPPPPDVPVVCSGSRAPVVLGEALSFCGYTGISCCDAVDDAALREEFDTMMRAPQPDAACAATAVKAALCAIRCGPSRSLSNSTSGTTVSLPLLCASPPPSTASTRLPDAATTPPQQGAVCLERVAEGAYLAMAAHPDGSGRAFLSTQDGKVWLASVPAHGSGGAMHVHDGASPFLDLMDRVRHHNTAVRRLMGVAFHPEFATNGRFFVSYTCDSSASPDCGAGSGCSSAAANGSTMPCRYQLVIAEFSAEGSGYYSKAARADPSEVRRIFTMGLPQPHTSYSYQQHAGQILFRPSDVDEYLYLITGHGGGEEAHGQSHNSSQNKGSFLGKIIRFDVGHSTPEPEVFAMGPSNPRGCSFDSGRPSDLYCADVDEQRYEQVGLISDKADGNDSASSATPVVSPVVGHGRPAAGRAPTIVGGLVYRGSEDPSLKGRYVYMYGFSAWAAMETPERSGRYAAARIPNTMCSRTSPVPCGAGSGIGGRVVSFGEDNRKDAFVLATDGVYRVARSALCCGGAPPPPQPPPPASGLPWVLSLGAFALAFAFYLVYLAVFAGGGQIITGCCNEWRSSVVCCVHVTNNGGGGGGRAENRA